jgi:peptide deformylase|uniref:Peptide deformylase n=1 Tax=candidate division WOR-3 bacterium TaxID=2052148 RepID=A0A7V3RI93_UNCW3
MEIVKYPDEILRKRAIPIERITNEIFSLAESMIETMLKNDGVGLAANQVGSLHRLFVLNLKPFDEKPEPVVVINPRILRREEIVEDEEGCLSFPGLFIHIPRFKRILLHYQNLYNEPILIETEGIVARAIQHELDHLNGILFIDYVNEKEKIKVDQYLHNLTKV